MKVELDKDVWGADCTYTKFVEDHKEELTGDIDNISKETIAEMVDILTTDARFEVQFEAYECLKYFYIAIVQYKYFPRFQDHDMVKRVLDTASKLEDDIKSGPTVYKLITDEMQKECFLSALRYGAAPYADEKEYQDAMKVKDIPKELKDTQAFCQRDNIKKFLVEYVSSPRGYAGLITNSVVDYETHPHETDPWISPEES